MTANARLGVVMIVSLVVLLWPSPALAKGPPDRLSVSGPGLAQPVEIADAASLAKFDPWTRGFIVWERGLAAKPPLAQTYTVSFYMKRDGRLAVIYVLRYAPDPAGGPGYIYIPGPGEPEYRLNIGTIITGDSDRWNPNGKWQYATAEWDAVMRRALGAQGAAPGGGAGGIPALLPRGGGASGLWLMPPAAALTAGPIWGARRLRRRRAA